MPITLLLADAHELVREGVRALIETEPRYVIVAEARDGREAIQLAAKFSPRIILLDPNLLYESGLEVIAYIHAHHRCSRIIALSSSTEQCLIDRVIAAGAVAYVSKFQPFRELCRVIDAVHSHQLYNTCHVTDLVHINESTLSGGRQLSLREQQTLRFIAQGKSSLDIAAQLRICLKTVEAHRHNLRQKLGLRSIAELTRYAITHEMTTAVDQS